MGVLVLDRSEIAQSAADVKKNPASVIDMPLTAAESCLSKFSALWMCAHTAQPESAP
jgi:hypothetical protein